MSQDSLPHRPVQRQDVPSRADEVTSVCTSLSSSWTFFEVYLLELLGVYLIVT